jgi:hypothetical protein
MRGAGRFRETSLPDFAKHLNCHPEPAKTAKDLTDSNGGTHTKLCDARAHARSLGALRLPRDDRVEKPSAGMMIVCRSM